MNNKQWVLGNKNNSKNIVAINMLKDWNSSYSNHMFDHNRIIEAFNMSSFGGVDFFNQPICKVCFKPGAQIGDKTFIGEDKYIGPDSMKSYVYSDIEKIKADGEYDVYFRKAISCYCDIHGLSKDTKTVREYLIEDLKIPPKVLLEIELKYYSEEETKNA